MITNEMLEKALEQIDNLTAEEFENDCRRLGYYNDADQFVKLNVGK